MVTLSIQETFGQTALELLSCGKSGVASNNTGSEDIVEHHHDGCLAAPFEVKDLTKGIVRVLKDSDRHQNLHFQAHQNSLRNFALQTQAQQYLSLYQEALEFWHNDTNHHFVFPRVFYKQTLKTFTLSKTGDIS